MVLVARSKKRRLRRALLGLGQVSKTFIPLSTPAKGSKFNWIGLRGIYARGVVGNIAQSTHKTTGLPGGQGDCAHAEPVTSEG